MYKKVRKRTKKSREGRIWATSFAWHICAHRCQVNMAEWAYGGSIGIQTKVLYHATIVTLVTAPTDGQQKSLMRVSHSEINSESLGRLEQQTASYHRLRIDIIQYTKLVARRLSQLWAGRPCGTTNSQFHTQSANTYIKCFAVGPKKLRGEHAIRGEWNQRDALLHALSQNLNLSVQHVWWKSNNYKYKTYHNACKVQ